MPRKSAKSQTADPLANHQAKSEVPSLEVLGSEVTGSEVLRSEVLGSELKNSAERLGIQRIVSGGQTGVDRGALDAAITLGIEHGGWCPRGRMAEDGPVPARYRLRETEAVEYAVRTERNVIDSDGTLLFYRGRLQRGTLLTYRLAQKHARPVLRVRLDLPVEVAKIQQWIIDKNIHVLNVAGPRASSCPGIEIETTELLTRIFTVPLRGSLFDGEA